MFEDALMLYRQLQKEFMSVGASLEEAAQLAAAFVASRQNQPERGRFFSTKNHPDAVTYRYRGIALEVNHLRIHENREGQRGFMLSLRTKVGRTIQELPFKGEQALRIVALLALKYEQFETDTIRGFSPSDLRAREIQIVERLTSLGQRMDYPDSDTVELTRNIRRKIEDKLQLFGLLHNTESSGCCRLELPPNLIDWDEPSMLLMDDITAGALCRWQDSYGFAGEGNLSR